MSISLEQLTQILAKAGISSSQEEEILIAAEILITPPETDNESTHEKCKQEEEEDNEELQHDVSETNYTYERLIEQWFQAGTRLKSFSFSFSFANLEFQQFSDYLLYIYVYSQLSFVKLEETYAYYYYVNGFTGNVITHNFFLISN
jgi:hypothetical protein